MDKWEYLQCTLGNYTIISTNLPTTDFAAAFPAQKVTSSRKGIISIEWKGKADEVGWFGITVLNYLGSQGWEAYGSSGNLYYFKRKV